MKLTEVIRQLEEFAAQLGPDAEFVLFNRSADRELLLDPDADTWDFEFTRGDNEAVIEFD